MVYVAGLHGHILRYIPAEYFVSKIILQLGQRFPQKNWCHLNKDSSLRFKENSLHLQGQNERISLSLPGDLALVFEDWNLHLRLSQTDQQMSGRGPEVRKCAHSLGSVLEEIGLGNKQLATTKQNEDGPVGLNDSSLPVPRTIQVDNEELDQCTSLGRSISCTDLSHIMQTHVSMTNYYKIMMLAVDSNHYLA